MRGRRPSTARPKQAAITAPIRLIGRNELARSLSGKLRLHDKEIGMEGEAEGEVEVER